MTVNSYSSDYTNVLGSFTKPLTEGAISGNDVYFSFGQQIFFDLSTLPPPPYTNFVDIYQGRVHIDSGLTFINTSSFDQVDGALKLGSYCWTKGDYNYPPQFLNYLSQEIGNFTCFSADDKLGDSIGTLSEVFTLSSFVPTVIGDGIRVRLTGTQISDVTISAEYYVTRLTIDGPTADIAWISVGNVYY